jgi:hypothetical protein
MDTGSEQIYFKLCSDHISLEAIPRIKLKVDFAKIREHPPHDSKLIMWTPHFAVIRTQDGQEITLRKDGRMIIRKSDSENTAQQAAAEMLNLIIKDFSV